MPDPKWPNKPGVRYNVMSCLVLDGATGQGEVNHCSRARWAWGGERQLLCVFPCFCTFFLLVLLLLLFASFDVLLNCPYPDPQIFPFSSDASPHCTGEGAAIEQARGSLLLTGAKPLQYCKGNFSQVDYLVKTCQKPKLWKIASN